MGKVAPSMSMSLDGYVTGPHDSREHPLGEGGEVLHRRLGQAGTQADHAVLQEMVDGAGAILMGRRSYGFCVGDGGWGDGGPAGDTPLFVLTHHAPDPADAPPVFTFVADGIESAIAQAKAAVGHHAVGLHGATAAQQSLAAGLLDEIQVHLVPVLLGGGVRLFDRRTLVYEPGSTLLGANPVDLYETALSKPAAASPTCASAYPADHARIRPTGSDGPNATTIRPTRDDARLQRTADTARFPWIAVQQRDPPSHRVLTLVAARRVKLAEPQRDVFRCWILEVAARCGTAEPDAQLSRIGEVYPVPVARRGIDTMTKEESTR